MDPAKTVGDETTNPLAEDVADDGEDDVEPGALDAAAPIDSEAVAARAAETITADTFDVEVRNAGKEQQSPEHKKRKHKKKHGKKKSHSGHDDKKKTTPIAVEATNTFLLAQRERLQGVEPRLFDCIEEFMPLHDEYELRHLLDGWAGLGAMLWTFKKAIMGVARLDMNFISGALACCFGAFNSPCRTHLFAPLLICGRCMCSREQSLLTRCDEIAALFSSGLKLKNESL
eukprot:COSAG06_NODE_14288_length_1170_cov_0.839402_2_plen_230_part_00